MSDDQSPGGSDPQQPKRTVRATRRRPDAQGGAGDRERAEAPDRQLPQQPQQPYAQQGGGLPPRPPQPYAQGGSAGGAAGGGGMRNLVMIGILLLLLVVGGPTLFSGLGGATAPEAQPQQPQQPQQPAQQATVRPQPTARPPASAQAPAGGAASAPATGATGGDRWLVMLYQDADDRVLEQDIFLDLNEAERVGSNDQVQIVSQIDRFQGGFADDGDWTSTKRFYVTQDRDLRRIGSQEVADLGEANMADSATLVDFATWAIQTYPSDKYALILSDHGIGWPGGWSDPTAQTRGPSDLPLASALGDQLYLMEIDQALGQIRANTGLDKLEMIGMDACLMGHLEVYTALAPHARYMVGSQEVEPALGWAYASFLSALQQNPGMNGDELSRLIVESYIDRDERIIDDNARADFVGRGTGSLLGSLFGPVEAPSAAEITQQLSRNITLSAIDLQATDALNSAFNQFAFALQGADQRTIAQARTYSQSYTSVFGETVPPSYIDIGNFAQLAVQASRDPNVQAAAQGVLDALGNAVLAERHGSNKPGSTGASIYFPNSQLYGNAAAGPQSYTVAARRFAEQSLWDDYLAYHYTGRPFEQAAAEVAVPDRVTIAPPAAAIQVSPLSVSAPSVAIGDTVLLSADIAGDNLGYVKLLVGFLDQDANSLRILDGDYLDSGETREVGGVRYPDWGQGEFTLEFEWEPIVTAISDGQTTAVAYLQPEDYGATPEEATYAVDGIYTFAQDGQQRPARLLFRDNRLRQVLTFTGTDSSTGAPWETAPRTGDRFQVAEQWLDLDAAGQTSQQRLQLGETLTFGDDVFTLSELDAPAGDYVVGYIVEDLDGRPTATYGRVRVD